MEVNSSTLSGVYLVVDPAMDRDVLLDKIDHALDGGVDIIQIWNHWDSSASTMDKKELIAEVIDLAEEYDVPVLINEDWKLLKSTWLSGVHFDERPNNFESIKMEVGRDFIAGITCTNDLDTIRWAEDHGFDYASFCAMFPSPSVDSCEIVKPETVKKARKMTDMPLFLSGGITPDNLGELSELEFSGVAVISGILKSDSPEGETNAYKKALDSSNK